MVPSITWLFRSVNFLNCFHVHFSLKTNIITVKNSAASLFSYYCLRTKRSFILTSSLIRQQKFDSSVLVARSDSQNLVSVDIILVLFVVVSLMYALQRWCGTKVTCFISYNYRKIMKLGLKTLNFKNRSWVLFATVQLYCISVDVWCCDFVVSAGGCTGDWTRRVHTFVRFRGGRLQLFC